MVEGISTQKHNINPELGFGDDVITDLYPILEACYKDNLIKYSTNGTGVYDEGATNCDPDSTPQITPFTWVFNLTETKIIEDGETYNLVELSGTTLKTSFVVDGGDFGGIPGVKHTISATYKH